MIRYQRSLVNISFRKQERDDDTRAPAMRAALRAVGPVAQARTDAQPLLAEVRKLRSGMETSCSEHTVQGVTQTVIVLNHNHGPLRAHWYRLR